MFSHAEYSLFSVVNTGRIIQSLSIKESLEEGVKILKFKKGLPTRKKTAL